MPRYPRVTAVNPAGFDGITQNQSNMRSSSQRHQSENDAPIFDELLNSAIKALDDKTSEKDSNRTA